MNDRERHMIAGRYVVHKFGRYRSGRHQKCERCGVKRRYRSSGWEWTDPQFHPAVRWTVYNPACADRPRKL